MMSSMMTGILAVAGVAAILLCLAALHYNKGPET